MLASVTAAAFAATTASAQAIEPILQGFSAPVGIHALGDADLLVSNWSGGTVERVGANGTRAVFLDGISSPAGIAVDATGAVFVSSYSSDIIVRIAPDGRRETVADGLATPTGNDSPSGASVVRRVSFDGQASVVVDGLSGSAVALGSAANGDLLVGTWGGGNVYRVAWPKS